DAVGNLTSMTDPRGNETTTTYDSRNRATVRTVAVGTTAEAKTETDYDLAGNVTEVRSPRYFDATDTEGHNKAKEIWTYTPANKVASHTEAAGTTIAATESFVYDLNGRRTEHVDFDGETSKIHYVDCCGQVIAQENPLGHGSLIRKDPMGRSVHQVVFEDYSAHSSALDNPVDAKTLREVTTKYDGRGRPVARTTWLTARGTVDANDPPIAGLNSVPASDGLTVQYLYDDDLGDGTGLDSSSGVAGVLGGTVVSLTTALNKLDDAIASGGAGVTFDATNNGSARVVISAEGEVRFTISDAAGRSVMSGMLNSSNALITWRCQAYDQTESISGFGTVLASISVDADGKTSKSLSDGARRMIRSVDQLAKVTTYEYDAGGNRLKIRDPNSVGQDCLYDALGRQTQCTDTGSDVTKSSYDLAGNKITSTDAKNEDTTYNYDARGRQIKQTDRLGGETEFAYTDMNRLSSLTDAENQVTSYTYDAAGFKLTETYPDHTGGSPGASTYGIVTFTPDAAGRVLRKQDQLGDTVTYNYDLAGRLTSRQYRTAANSPSGTVADTDSFTYDDAGRMLTAVSGRYSNTVTYTYDNAGRKSTEALTISGQTYTVTTAYDTQGRVSALTYPDGTSVGRTYTDRSQLATIIVGSTTIDTRTYDDGGRMTASSYNNGVSESRTYNNDNTLASISYTGAAIGNLTYGWDANKNKTSEGIAGTMAAYTLDEAVYDLEDRLEEAQYISGDDYSWSLSLVGDWSSYTENGSTQTRTHGPSHELLTAASQAIQHDVKGNITLIPGVLRPSGVTMTLTWDFDNRLSTADVDNNSTVDVTYKWDALGRRVFRDDGTTASVYVQNGQQSIADYTSGTAASSPTYNYVYASYIDEPVLRTGTGGDRYYHRGQQYSITALTDSLGAIKERYAFDAYGGLSILDSSGTARTSTAESNRYTYTGREWDEMLGLYHFRYRIYDPAAGRFYGRDPMGYWDGTGLYGNQFGLNGVDPTGLKSFQTCNFRIYAGHTHNPEREIRKLYGKKGLDCKVTEVGVICCNSKQVCKKFSNLPLMPEVPLYPMPIPFELGIEKFKDALKAAAAKASGYCNKKRCGKKCDRISIVVYCDFDMRNHLGPDLTRKLCDHTAVYNCRLQEWEREIQVDP
ncbi:MAG: RHS repeat-associated core domain-containing protein, partial [Planctomycetota bacterium]